MRGEVSLPVEALAKWRTLEERRTEPVDPSERVSCWMGRLRARMLCSGGRLTPLLIAMGLSNVETLAACVCAQLRAGAIGQSQFSHDVEADLDELAELGSLEILETLSSKVAELDWLAERSGSLHGRVAERFVEIGDETSAEVVLERMTSYGLLVDWIERHGAKLSPRVRVHLVQRAELLVESAALPPVNRVHVFVQLANLTRERRWLERAREIWVTLSPEELEDSGYATPLSSTLVGGFAEQGAFDQAMRIIDTLSPDDRWSALLELTPMLPEGTTRTRAITELVNEVRSAQRPCWRLVPALPETLGRVLTIIEAITDDEKRLEELAALIEYLDLEEARRACGQMLALAGHDPSVPSWFTTWGQLLASLIAAGEETLLDTETRRWLIETLLVSSNDDLWPEAAAFVPDDCASKVLELSRARLEIATHYTVRDTWIEVGLAVLARAPRDQAESWREIAAVQMVGTSIEGHGRHRLGAWSQDQQRAIVLARLLQHQCEFLPAWEIEPWLRHVRLAREAQATGSAILPAVDPRERAEALQVLETLTSTTAWPTFEHVGRVFESLARCAGEEAVEKVLREID